MTKAKDNITASQRDRFIETARELGCDEDKERFEAALGKIASRASKPKSGAENRQKGKTPK